MTTILELCLRNLDLEAVRAFEVTIEDGHVVVPGGRGEFDMTPRDQVRRVAQMANAYGTGAWIHEDGEYGDKNHIAMIIPAALARELVAEGRLKWPLCTSRTVPARGE